MQMQKKHSLDAIALLKPYFFSFMLTEFEQITWNYQKEKACFPLANSFY